MRVKYFALLTKLFAVAVIALVVIVPAQAQVAWVQQSIYTVKVKNNTSAQADQFKLIITGLDIYSIDLQQCSSSNYSSCNITQNDNQNNDPNELTITWSQGSTAVGQNATFSIVVNRYVSLQSCDMIWADANGEALGHIDDVWQDWTTSGSAVYGTISNRTSDTRYVTRAIGYATGMTSVSDLNSMSIPPNAIVLDPTAPSPIAAGSSSTYDFSPYYIANRSTFMFYKVYADSSATSPLVSFKTVAITTPPAGGITFDNNFEIDDYFISSPTERPYYEVVSARAVADKYEDLQLNWIVVDTNSDSVSPVDITVKIWQDVNNDGKVDTSIDQLLGSAVLSAGSNYTTIKMTPAITIQKGCGMDLVVTYTLPASTPAGSAFYASIGDASATGYTSGIRVPRTGDWFDGAAVIVTPPATTIGDAKKLQINPTNGQTDIVWFENMYVTGFFPNENVVYIEDKDRISGIAVRLDGDYPDFQEGMKVSVMGRLTVRDGVEAELEPIDGKIGDITTPLTPLFMTNKATGGGMFGIQPAVINDASSGIFAGGLNNIGKFIKTVGQVTGTTALEVGDGMVVNIAWIDDGSSLWDGVSENKGMAIMMPSDWDGTPLSGMVTVKGIIRAQQSPDGTTIRVLYPRTMDDIK